MAAACAPSLLAYNAAPSATFLNQALALLFWGLLAAACGLECRRVPGRPGSAGRLRASGTGSPSGDNGRSGTSGPHGPKGPKDHRGSARSAVVLPALALALLMSAALASHVLGTLPRSLAWSALTTLAAAAVLLFAGARAGASRPDSAGRVLGYFAVAWLVAGLLSAAIGAVQVLAPQWADGLLIARSGLVGRAIGNLRQPNHVCTLLLWAAISVLALLELKWLQPRQAALCLLALAFGLVLTASRTAVLGVVLMAAWGLADRRLSKPARWCLLAMPVLYAVCWWGLSAWAHAAQATLGAEQRLAELDLSASRFRIWADCLQLIRQHPWTGVGFGEFNFAWSLSVLPQRPVAFFDHAHNLFLHWAVELGLPAAALLCLMLGAAGLRMVLAVWRTKQAAPERSLGLRVTLAFLALMLLHSQLEYPLWYAYFLLPTAWLMGFGLAQAQSLNGQRHLPRNSASTSANTPASTSAITAHSATQAAPRDHQALGKPSVGLVLAGLFCAAGAVAAVADYTRVVAVYDAQSETPLQERLRVGLRSAFFSHQAAYAAATVSREPAQEMDALRQAAHNLLDTRLMIAWAKAYADSGDLPRAQYLVARLREFRNPAAADFFEPCDAPAPQAALAQPQAPQAQAPFQCQPPDPHVMLGWTHFR